MLCRVVPIAFPPSVSALVISSKIPFNLHGFAPRVASSANRSGGRGDSRIRSADNGHKLNPPQLEKDR